MRFSFFILPVARMNSEGIAAEGPGTAQF